MYDKRCKEEEKRKEQLFKLFDTLEVKEHKRYKKNYQKNNKDFEKIFNGFAIVKKINQSTLELEKENGRPLGSLLVTPQIAKLIKVNDHLMMTARKEENLLRFMCIQSISSFMETEDQKTIISGSFNPKIYQ